MQKFTLLSGVAAPLNMINIDTDMIIPKQFLKTIKRSGLGQYLFHELRTDESGALNRDFVLNQPGGQNAQILITGENFGCGSSREHAPWALMDFGIRCVIASSFADIFRMNAIKNGILPIILPPDKIALLMEDAKKGANARIDINLPDQEITRPDGSKINFEIEASDKHCLLNGLDDIALTLEKQKSISDFEDKHRQAQPWI